MASRRVEHVLLGHGVKGGRIRRWGILMESVGLHGPGCDRMEALMIHITRRACRLKRSGSGFDRLP